EYVGFIAEDVPALVAMRDRKSLAAMDIVAVLTKVAKEQKAQLSEQKAQLSALKAEKDAEIAALKAELASVKASNADRIAKLEQAKITQDDEITLLKSKLEMLVRAAAAGNMAMVASNVYQK
ncbi:MAG: hypothetical protein Q9M12_04990, partial [Mariprofundus sp.]|nr:hypothetical protein [Mariprofundus sp.]